MTTRVLWGVAGVAALLLAVGVYLDIGASDTASTPVLIANRTIQAGTPGTIVAAQQMYTATTLPRKEVLDGAIADPTFLTGRAAAARILPGQQFTAIDFSIYRPALSLPAVAVGEEGAPTLKEAPDSGFPDRQYLLPAPQPADARVR